MAVTFLNGYIADDPATAATQVRVSVPNLTQLDRVVYGPLNFRPKLSAEGGVVFPQRGSKALIAVDDSSDGQAWIVSWEEVDGVDTTTKTTGTIAGASGGAIPMDTWHIVGAAGQPTFQNGWIPAPGDSPPSFRKFPDGTVQIKGLMTKSSGNFIVNELVFTLPSGYWPPYATRHTCRAAGGGTGEVANRVDVYADGTVRTVSGGAANPVTYATLDGIEFDTETVGSYISGIGGIPLGASLEWNAAGDPIGGLYMVEDGRTLDSVADPTLAPLFSVIGITWGGTGANSFKIPDSRGRTTIGAGTGSGLTARTLGAVLGTEPSNMPQHTHSGTTGTVSVDHVHSYVAAVICCTIDGGSTANVASAVGTTTGGISANHTHAFTTGNANSGDVTNNNMQPSIVKNKIIRVR